MTFSALNSRYEIQEVIAQGGMGIVYKAFDKVMKRQVAVKTLLDLTDKTALQLFQKECEDLAFLAHPNIIEIFDIGELEEDGVSRPYLVMPLLHGLTLEKLLRTSSRRLSVERSIDIICQVCRGLQAAHDKGLIHRDIKPSNIFVMDDDSVKIIDFGVAHRIETSRTVGRKGTLLYMAPEQIEMKPVSSVSDIFSLGVVCYETLTGLRPFERATEGSVVSAVLRFFPAPASELNPSVSPAVSQAIHKAMAKQPWYRYASVKDFGETLQKAHRNEPIEIFNPARIRPRLGRATKALDSGDSQFASEILGELEAEGHLDPGISDLRRQIDAAVRKKAVAQLLDSARARMDEGEYPLALQKVGEVLQMDPAHAEALSLRGKIESQRTERDISEWFGQAREQLEVFAFRRARESLKRILQARPGEGQALQLLADVDRLERESVRLRHEREHLFQAAVEADERGDIGSALERLEQVQDLDRRTPGPVAISRSAVYQSLYNKVRSQHEALQTTYADGRRHLEARDFAGALSICNTQLAKFPGQALFQALKIDIEEQRRQSLTADMAETDRQVEAESDLDRRVALLEDAVRDNPGGPHFDQLLQRTREKRDRVEPIVARARAHERQGQFSEALSQWEMLQTIYSRYPGLGTEMDRLNHRRQQHLQSEAKGKWVDRIDRLLEIRNYGSAVEVLAKAQEEFPGDSELAQLEKLARHGLERAAETDGEVETSTPNLTSAAIPAEEPADPQPLVNNPVEIVEAQTRIEPPGIWERVRSAIGGSRKTWSAAALAGLVLLTIVFVSVRKPAPVSTPLKASTGTVEVTTIPAGAVIWVNGKESGPATQPLRIELPVGPIEIEARLPGYQPALSKVDLTAAGHTPIALTLAPVLTLKLLSSRDGQVKVNDEEPQLLRDGQFVRQLPIGDYTVKLTSGRTASLSFSFKVVPDGPAVITSPPNARDLTTLLVSNFGGQGSIHTGGPPIKAKLDGQPLGELGASGLNLPKLTAANHELEFGEGNDVRKRAIEIGPERTLTAIVDSDPETGTLFVQTNEDSVAISIFSGKELVRSGETAGGRFRVDLRARTYTIRAAKQGYDSDKPQQQLEIRRREDHTVRFEFRRRQVTVSFRIRSNPGAEIFVDGSPVGTVPQDGIYTVTGLSPGSHAFRAEKGKQFQPNEKKIEVTARQSEPLDLQLVLAPVIIEIRKNPPDSTVTYTRPDDSSLYTFNGSRGPLQAGEYTFTARAKGYEDKVLRAHIAADANPILDLTQVREKPVAAAPPALTIADWGPGVWLLDHGWNQRKAAGQIFFPKPLGTGILHFSIHWYGKGRVQWYLNYLDANNYLLCELDDNRFQVERVIQGQKAKAPLTRTQVPKRDDYTIRISLRQDGIIQQLRDGEGWKPLSTTPGVVAPGGRFGFLIPSGQTLFLANFIFQPDR